MAFIHCKQFISHRCTSDFMRMTQKAILSLITGFSIGGGVSAVAQSAKVDANTIASPVYIVDYHQNDGDVTTLRNGLKTAVTAQFTRGLFDSQFSGDYRVIYQILDDTGNPINLANAINSDPTSAASSFFTVPSTSFFYEKQLTLYPDPIGTLDNQTDYTVRASLQRRISIFFAWSDVANSGKSSVPEYVHHFTQPTSGDKNFNVRATVNNLTWERRYALASSATKNSFQSSIDVEFGRYDDWNASIQSESIRLTLDFDLIEQSTGVSVPLVNNGIVSQTWLAPSYTQTKVKPKAPSYRTMNVTANLIPTGQLKSSSEKYIVRCTVKHTEGLLKNFTDATPELNAKGLLHFNGDLLFGAVEIQFDDLGNIPVYGATVGDHVFSIIKIPAGAGSIMQNAAYGFGSNVSLSVFLYDDGHTEIRAGSNTELVYDLADAAAPVTQTNNHVQLVYGPVTLGADGATAASTRVNLPQGTIYLADTQIDQQRGEDFILNPFSISLNGKLNIVGDMSIQLSDFAAMVDESHPLVVYTKQVTVTPAGRLVFSDIQGAKSIHAFAYNQIENEVDGGYMDPKDTQGRLLDERVSNDLYWKTVTEVLSPTVEVTAAPDASSRMTASFKVAASDYQTHFPAYASIKWTDDSSISLTSGVIEKNTLMAGVGLVDQPYHQTCTEDPCAAAVPKEKQSLTPDDNHLIFTLNGGLYQQGDLSETKPLAWGARGDETGQISKNYPYAHRTDDFSRARVYIPGYQLYASENPLLTTAPYAVDGGENAPGALLLAGFSGGDKFQEIYYPTQDKYINGDGFYPGFNMVVTSLEDRGASRLGGNLDDYPYTLVPGGASKYYNRCAGVFGRHVAKDHSFSPSLKIYGYDFELNSFQITFRASEQADESWVNGAIAITGHSDFTQQFTGLSLTCLGELDNATVDPDDRSPKNLIYWGSQFTPLAIDFPTAVTSAPGECPKTFTGYLTMGVSTNVAHIPSPLYGSLAFNASDGNLLTQTTGAAVDIDSELRPPAQLTVDGPAKNYTLVTTGKLRFSNPDEDPNASIGSPGGYVTLGATINVPYFKDFQVQMITSANPSPAAPLYLTPGWTEAGKTFFTHTDFDPNHTSWPKASLSIEEYQSPNETTADQFLIKAEQDLFGIVPLSYPLKWDDGSRSFTSMNPENDDLLILNINHQVDYLDAATTKVSFGIKYDGLPEISLTSLLNEQIDGAADAVSGAISAPLKGAIDAAFEEFDKLLADSLDAAIDPVVDEAATQVLNPLYDELKIHYNTARANGDDWNTFKANLDTEIEGRIYTPGAGNAGVALTLQLKKISDTAADAASLTADLQTAIEQIITGIDSITAQVEVVGGKPQFNIDPEAIAGSATNGLLKKSDGERQIVQSLVKLLLEDLVKPEIAAILVPLLNDATSELNAELNAQLQEIDPALEQITAALLQVREFLVDVHTQIADGQGMISDFQDLVAQAQTDINGFQAIQQKPATRALSYIEDLARDNGIDIAGGGTTLNTQLDLFEEFSKEQFVTAVKTELKDAILESDLIQQFRFLLHQTLYDLENKMEQTVASVLAQISGVMKELVSETVGALEDEINPMLGSVDEYMGAAEVVGYADFNGDSLRKLRMDASMQFKIPDEMQLNAFLEINAYTSEDEGNGCVSPGERAVEVVVGATDVPMDWISDGLRANIAAKMSLKDQGSGLRPNGFGGAFEITDGIIDFQTFQITSLAATIAIGGDEAFLGARAGGIFNSYEVSIGVFFGRTCTVDPLLLVDKDVGELFSSNMPITGAYVYGEVWLPISELVLGIPASCLFNISAGVGTGVGFFVNDALDPIFVGKMFAGISGEALCVISIKGTVTMVGIVQDGSFSASGTGRLKGKAGACPFCIKFSASAKVSYSDGDWDIDY